MIDQHQRELLTRFLNGQCSADEEKEARVILDLPGAKEFLHHLMMSDAMQTEQDGNASDNTTFQNKATYLKHKVNERIAQAANRKQKNSWPLGNLMRYAAVFIGLVLLAGSIWFWKSENTTDGSELVQHAPDILPGGDKALLTLADGSVISLSDAQNGTIATQGGIRIEKDAEGNIRYLVDRKNQTSTLAMNTVATPNGGQYRITLPDGSQAWLNAASSLTYPVHFSKNERRVKMTGEVYFEIAKLKQTNGKDNVPFFVETDKQEIKVLGTQFNVNAYENEPFIQTTLVEGSVQVTASKTGKQVRLQPGQQAILNGQLRVETADIQQQLAWKNGDFIFREENLQQVLRQVARWYNIEIICPDHLGQLRLNGMISRSKPLSTVIDMIETTHKDKIKLALKERRLIVTD
ncbi:FecR domain-containing protein [Sphingobacterium lactis]|uniref:FecR family protein n=1 Tax=Sphingobacterium lactis TaxID=797291 RepID=UPI003EC86160